MDVIKENNMAKKKKSTKAKSNTKKKKQSSLCDVSLEAMLEAGCHFGHQAKRWNPKMESYLWKVRKGIHIFDLIKTKKKLQEACKAVQELVSNGGTIIFLGTKRQAKEIIRQEAKKAGVFYIISRWLGGTITNWKQIKKSLEKMIEMQKKKEKGEYEKYTKKENVLIEREINRLNRFFEGLVGLKDIPTAIFVVDVNREIAAVKEANMRNIKVFAITDSNADPELVDYAIPANDDAVQSIKLIVSAFADAVAKAKPQKPKSNQKPKQSNKSKKSKKEKK